MLEYYDEPFVYLLKSLLGSEEIEEIHSEFVDDGDELWEHPDEFNCLLSLQGSSSRMSYGAIDYGHLGDGRKAVAVQDASPVLIFVAK